MILNVSGRTDIVAFYTPWFINRYKEGYVDVRNPIYNKLVSRIYFKDVDMIVFCTKNPRPIIEFLPYIKEPILFHVTLTAYQKDIERGVKNKKDIIEDIKRISNIIGKESVYLRYDPMFLNDKYTLDYHIKAFNKVCSLLEGYVTHIIISFLDNYKNVQKNMDVLRVKKYKEEDFKEIGVKFSQIAKCYNMTVQTCSEYNNLSQYGFLINDCVSRNLVFLKTGKKSKKWISRNNKFCNCAAMVDIGEYNTCEHYCKYCYANYNENIIKENIEKHNPNSSLLIGNLEEDDIIKVRET